MITTTKDITLTEIDHLASEYAKARWVLAARVGALEAEVAALQRRRIASIKDAASVAEVHQEYLRTAIEGAPHLFVKPKTFTLHGITCGYRKGAGKADWDDSAKVCALIRKHLPEQAEVLIIVEERPSADALKNLDARDLARVGVRMEGTGEFVVVKSADSAIDKLVTKILKEGTRAAGEEAA